MSIWKKSRFQVWGQDQHPYKHVLGDFAFASPLLPNITTLQGALDYIVAVLYPKYIGTFATQAALPALANPNDYAIVSDDGTGHAAGYVWISLDGVAGWNKRYDMQWSMDSVLAETVNRTQYMYVQKYGLDDTDSSGTALVGVDAGQHIYGGASASTNLTLHANSGDTVGTRTGFVQSDDNFRPTVTDTLDVGTAILRWNNGYFKNLSIATLTSSSDVTVGGNLAVTGNAVITGSISASNLSGTNTGDVSVASVGATPNAAGASVTGQVLTLEPADGTNPGVLTALSQTIGGDKTFTGNLSALTLTATGNAAVGGNLVVTGTVTGANLSGTNSGDVTLTAVGSTPGANGASLAGQALTLQPADATNPGVTTATTQTFGGAKTWNTVGTFSAAGTALSVTNDATVGNNLKVGNALQTGATSFLMSDLMALRNTVFRDAARTQPAQNGDAMFYDSTSGTWLASVPDTEIVHSAISGLTVGDAGHTQFVMLSGRTGGQTVQGGTAASENLTLESTSNATKGLVQVKDNFVAFTNATFSSGWNGTDIGSATHAFRDVYTKGQFFGLRLENNAAPVASSQNPGRLVYKTGDIVSVDNGGTFVDLVMTTQAQSIGGVKTFTSNMLVTAKVGIGTGPITPNVELDVLGSIATRRSDVASAAQILSLTTSTSFVKLTGVLTTEIDGLANGFDGKRVVVYNGSTATVTIKHQNTNAAAGDRIITPSSGDLVLTSNKSAEFIYEASQSRWVTSSSGSGGGNYTTSATQFVGSGGTITTTNFDGFQFCPVQGLTGAWVASTTPFGNGGAWQDGTVITLCGQDDTNTLTITNSDIQYGCILNGDCVLGKNQTVTVIYNKTAQRFIQISRNA